MDRESWCAAIHGVAKSWTLLSDWTELSWENKSFRDVPSMGLWSGIFMYLCLSIIYLGLFLVMLILSSFWPLKLVDRKGSGSQKLYTKKCNCYTRKFVWYRDSKYPGTLGMGPCGFAPCLLYSYITVDCWFISLKRNKSLEKCLSFKAISHMHSLPFLGSNSSSVSLSKQFNSISTCFCILANNYIITTRNTPSVNKLQNKSSWLLIESKLEWWH